MTWIPNNKKLHGNTTSPKKFDGKILALWVAKIGKFWKTKIINLKIAENLEKFVKFSKP